MKRNDNVNSVKRIEFRDERGAALFVSLMLLLVFSTLGTAYVKSMTISLEGTRYDLQNVRANHLSRGGVYAGIGEIQASIEKGEQPGSSYTIDLPVYRMVEGERESYPQTVAVTVSDESGKANLNFAPKPVLVALGIPAKVVDAIRQQAQGASGRLLVSVDDLRTRDFLNGQSYNALNKNAFTVYTGSVNGAGAAINLNSATPAVLAAVFGIDMEEASALAGKRPFTSWDDVRAKVAREPSTFNVPVVISGDRGMPEALSLGSRSYRLSSEAFMKTLDTSSNGLHSAVEAVVTYAVDGSFAIRYWNETPSNEVLSDGNVEASTPVTPSDNEKDDNSEVTKPVDAGVKINL